MSCMEKYYSAVGAAIIIFAGQSYASVEETCPNEAIAIVRADWLNRASDIYGEISDDSKSLYGRRSRFDWKEWSICELRREANFYRDALRAEYEREKMAKEYRQRERVSRKNAAALAKRKFDKGFNSLAAALANA